MSFLMASQDITLPFLPALYNDNFLDGILGPAPIPTAPSGGPTTEAQAPKNAMIDALKSTVHQTLTENRAMAYDSTLSATLDAFHGLTTYVYSSEVKRYLDSAWKEDEQLTLRVIWNLRSIHDGKGENELFYRAFGWLYENHPRTAIKNLPLLVQPVCKKGKSDDDPSLAHGYWKDLLNILALATVNELSVEAAPKFLHNAVPSQKEKRRTSKGSRKKRKLYEPRSDLAARLEENAARQNVEKVEARQARTAAASQAHQRLTKKLSEPKYLALFVAVARLFSDQLIKDLHVLKKLEGIKSAEERAELVKQISLAGKWAPTPLASHDRITNISTAISLLLHHHQMSAPFTYPSAASESLTIKQSFTLRSWLQRSVLTPLRRTMVIPEPLMSSNRWNEIKYSRVASKCMKINAQKFYTNDPEGFEKYLMDVESGKKKISGATLMPHEIIGQLVARGNTQFQGGKRKKGFSLKELQSKLGATETRVLEAQWKTLLDRMRESGSLDNCLAVCDVSGSMGSIYAKYDPKRVQPILPAISLSLLLAQLAKPPFENNFITFSSNPKFVELDPSKTLSENVSTLARADWEMNTDFDAVFLRLILPVAQSKKVKQEDMIKRLFVFSDMQFDESRTQRKKTRKGNWETNHNIIEKAYKKAGYEVPQIVYWNLADSFKSVPVTGEKKGVALMSGFSPALMKVFMGEAEEAEEETWEEVKDDGTTDKVEAEKEAFTPVNVMKKALLKTSFDGLVVLD